MLRLHHRHNTIVKLFFPVRVHRKVSISTFKSRWCRKIFILDAEFLVLMDNSNTYFLREPSCNSLCTLNRKSSQIYHFIFPTLFFYPGPFRHWILSLAHFATTNYCLFHFARLHGAWTNGACIYSYYIATPCQTSLTSKWIRYKQLPA